MCQNRCVTRTPWKGLADQEILQFWSTLATTILTHTCRSVGILSNPLGGPPAVPEWRRWFHSSRNMPHRTAEVLVGAVKGGRGGDESHSTPLWRDSRKREFIRET